MTEDRDPFLQTLFAEGQLELEGDAFIEDVMARTRNVRRSLYLSFAAMVLSFIAVALMAGWPLLGLAITFSEVLGMELISFGNSTISWMLLPINNLATLLVLLWRVVLVAWNRASSASYIS